MHSVVLLLGSNIDKEKMLPAAVRLLAEEVELLAISPVYEAVAVESYKHPNFFNAAVLIRTNKTATALKDDTLTNIEQQLGRQRTADKNAPRTIDLDIILFDDLAFDYTPADGHARHIPEPNLLQYAYCAYPVADLLPTMSHPETGETMRIIAKRIAREEASRVVPTVWKREDFDLRPQIEAPSSTC
ncbi:MAG: 2-amino-4-hydroxy-6-hydroxymethyldihydropteridine diphosphokinase [Anaerolineae bacterium]|nr:2-amino-4-hydroxy-6-hydroxymethyldihydropteridine diphosphokinase [Promineifilum sp.]MCZ2115752.1 2-amino-4-hydroxy-6-hydroxymethyldihydropteridine diphosphokinase [Anaerolineae bacterium]